MTQKIMNQSLQWPVSNLSFDKVFLHGFDLLIIFRNDVNSLLSPTNRLSLLDELTLFPNVFPQSAFDI